MFAVWSLHVGTKNMNTHKMTTTVVFGEIMRIIMPHFCEWTDKLLSWEKKKSSFKNMEEINDSRWSAPEEDPVGSRANTSCLCTSIVRGTQEWQPREEALPKQGFPSHSMTLKSQQCPSHLRPDYKQDWGVSWAERPNWLLGHLGPATTWMGLLFSNPTQLHE